MGRGAAPSPFVVLIREMQKLIPVEYRRHHRSDGSLAANILRATRSIRLQRHQVAARGNQKGRSPRFSAWRSERKTRRAGTITTRPAI